MKKTLAVVTVVAASMGTGCQTSSTGQNFPLGPVLGGVAGGFVGNQFGNGSGKAAATALGAVGGMLLGQQLQRPVVNQAPAPAPVFQPPQRQPTYTAPTPEPDTRDYEEQAVGTPFENIYTAPTSFAPTTGEGGLGEGDYIDPQTLQDMEDIASWTAEEDVPLDEKLTESNGLEGREPRDKLVDVL